MAFYMGSARFYSLIFPLGNDIKFDMLILQENVALLH